MSYIGNRPLIGNFAKLDSIASQFNGTTTSFTLKVGGNNTIAGTPQNLIIAIGGVIQEPNVAYTLSASTITFTSAPPTNATFWGVQLGDVLNIGYPSAGTVGLSQLSATGSASSTTFLRGDNSWAVPPASAVGGGTDQIFFLNGKTVTTSYSIPSNQNAHSVGPITINTGVTVTVPTGSRWVVL